MGREMGRDLGIGDGVEKSLEWEDVIGNGEVEMSP